jgi:hypothetical protein
MLIIANARTTMNTATRYEVEGRLFEWCRPNEIVSLHHLPLERPQAHVSKPYLRLALEWRLSSPLSNGKRQ